MKVRIAIIKPNSDEKRLWYETPTEITIGRSQNCTCCIDDDPMISRMHAVLVVDPPAIRLKDLNSTNGVMINGELYGGIGNEKLLQATLLREDDEVMVGNSLLRITLVEDADEPEAAIEPETAVRLTNQPECSVINLDVQGEAAAQDDALRPPVDLNLLAPAIPGYEISTFIGSGRTGSVYRAINLGTGDDVAVKVMFPELAFTRKMADTFRQGVDEMKRFAHSSMVRYLASGDVRVNSVYLTTEFIPGPNVAAVVEKIPDRKLPFEPAWSIFRQLAAGLGVAHQTGLLHLDMRLEKIIFESDASGYVKIADIGMARIFAESGLSVAGVNTNTQKNLAFMAPEQLIETREPKATADVFGIAAVLYTLLAGKSPYNFTEEEEPYETVARGDIVPLDTLVPDMPERMYTLLERCLLPDPDYRYRNCSELAEAVEGLSI